MPLTLTYDLERLTKKNSNAHAYIRNAFERFNWKKKGRSTFIYNPPREEDWLNDVIPALMVTAVRGGVLPRRPQKLHPRAHDDEAHAGEVG